MRTRTRARPARRAAGSAAPGGRAWPPRSGRRGRAARQACDDQGASRPHPPVFRAPSEGGRRSLSSAPRGPAVRRQPVSNERDRGCETPRPSCRRTRRARAGPRAGPCGAQLFRGREAILPIGIVPTNRPMPRVDDLMNVPSPPREDRNHLVSPRLCSSPRSPTSGYGWVGDGRADARSRRAQPLGDKPGQDVLLGARETKLDLVRYYLAVAEPFLRAAGGRPTLMQRFPAGAEGKSFFQKRVPKGARSGSRPRSSPHRTGRPPARSCSPIWRT